MKTVGFSLFVMFSLLASLVLTVSLINAGWFHLAGYIGLVVLAALIWFGFRFFYAEA